MTDKLINPESQGSGLSWVRIIGLAAAMSIHGAAFLLMMVPVPPPDQGQQEEEVVEVTFIEPPPPEAAPPVVLDEATPMSIPAPPPAPPAPSVPAPSYGATEDTSYRRLRPPRYPPQALRRREEGEVILRVLVDTDGRPVEIEVEKSSRSRLLDQAAVQAVRQWVFNPGMKDGKQVQSWVLVPIKFSLSDA